MNCCILCFLFAEDGTACFTLLTGGYGSFLVNELHMVRSPMESKTWIAAALLCLKFNTQSMI